MKAILLAAGLGIRLRSLTDKKPKVMLPILERPLLEHHILLLKKHRITDIGINLHHFPEIITDYFGDGSKLGVNIFYSYEENLLGTSGAVRKFFADGFLDREESFLVIYGDNLTNPDYTKLATLHLERKNSLGTILLYKCSDAQDKGIVITDENGRVLKFLEKPGKGVTEVDTVNGGIYCLNSKILDLIPEGFSDFGFDIFPKLLELEHEIFAFDIGTYVQDIGTVGRYKKAQKDAKKVLKHENNKA